MEWLSKNPPKAPKLRDPPGDLLQIISSVDGMLLLNQLNQKLEKYLVWAFWSTEIYERVSSLWIILTDERVINALLNLPKDNDGAYENMIIAIYEHLKRKNELSDNEIRFLVRYGHIYMDVNYLELNLDVEKLTEHQAKILSENVRYLYLLKLQNLDESVAKALFTWKITFFIFNSLRKISLNEEIANMLLHIHALHMPESTRYTIPEKLRNMILSSNSAVGGRVRLSVRREFVILDMVWN